MYLKLKVIYEKLLSSLSLTFLSFPYIIYVFLNTDLNYELLGLFMIGVDYFTMSQVKNYILRVLISTFFIVFFYCKLIFNDTEITIHQLRFRIYFIV